MTTNACDVEHPALPARLFFVLLVRDGCGTIRRVMRLRAPWLIRLVAWLASWVARGWMGTIRARVISLDDQTHPTDPRQSRYVYCFWHDGLMGPLKIRAQARVLISKHADGELIAQVCEQLGFGTIRGSTSRGGVAAVLEMIRGESDAAHLAITPDGPRGPRHQLQAGVILVASESGLPIVPLGVGYSRAWRAPSWDRFAVPWPFSTAVGVLGRPIFIPARLSRTELTSWQQEVERQLLAVQRQAEEIATGTSSEESRSAEEAAPADGWRESA